MNKQKITVKNAAYQRFETLARNREKRSKQGLFFLEGVHPIEHAIEHGWHLAAAGVTAGARLSGWAQDMLQRSKPDTLYEIDAPLMKELSDRENPCELIALVETRQDGLSRIKPTENPLYMLFDRPQSPGNLGSIIRSADSFGATALFTTGHGADFYDPQCIRASIGAMFVLPFHAFDSVEQVLEWINAQPVRPLLVGTSAHGTALLDEVDMTGPVMLLTGNEATGLSRTWKEHVDVLAKIPIYGSVSSLNAACAATACLYEVARQRRTK